MAATRALIRNVCQIVLCIIIALLIGAIFLLLQGENPLEIYYYLIVNPLTSGLGIIKSLGKATPLIFTGLAVAISFKCGLFNIGVEGQLLFGGLAAALVGYYGTGLPAALHMTISVLAGMAAGMLYAFIPAILKVKLMVHEVITTIMLNSIAAALTAFLIVNYFRNPGQTARTFTVAWSSRLPQLASPEHLNLGFVIAMICVVLLSILLKRTPFGLKLDAIGKNPVASKYSGIYSNQIVIITMLISGALAGLCGSERILGAFGYMQVNFSPGYGFDGITAAVIGKNNPIGAYIAAIFIGILQYGGTTINMMTNVPAEFVQALIAIMFVLVAAQGAIFHALGSAFNKRRKRVNAV